MLRAISKRLLEAIPLCSNYFSQEADAALIRQISSTEVLGNVIGKQLIHVNMSHLPLF